MEYLTAPVVAAIVGAGEPARGRGHEVLQGARADPDREMIVIGHQRPDQALAFGSLQGLAETSENVLFTDSVLEYAAPLQAPPYETIATA